MFYCLVIMREHLVKQSRRRKLNLVRNVVLLTEGSRISDNRYFWWRCAWGKHPFPSRTRRLRPRRPMVLHWRRCGRAGGRQIKKIKRKRFQIERAYAKSYANLNQQGSAVAILLVLPVIRVHKRLWVLMTDKTSVRDV